MSRRKRTARKVKRESARDLRGKLETLQSSYDTLRSREMTRDNALRELAELLRPFIEEIANDCATEAVFDHEIAEHKSHAR